MRDNVNCIVFDMEWNELMPYRLRDQNKLGFPLLGEIIEIGAVRLGADGELLDRFERLVRPTFLQKMHPQVSRLTGIRSEMLAKAPSFPEVLLEFLQWCGPNAKLLSWGVSDRQVLADNLRLHDLPQHLLLPWYDAQIIFGRTCLEDYEQYGVARACELLGIEMKDDAHRAINDAIYTAEICSKLPLQEEIGNYDRYGTTGVLDLQQTIQFHVFGEYTNKDALWDDPAVEKVVLADGRELALTERVKQRRNAYIALGITPDGERYLVRWKLTQYRAGESQRYVVAREVYEANLDLVHWYRDVEDRNREKRLRYEAKNHRFKRRKRGTW